MKKIIVIPARLSSTRLPNKVLLDLKGKTVLKRVFEQCNKVLDAEVYIATDSLKVRESCLKYTGNVINTRSDHKSGTDRIAEAIQKIECNIVVNVQGDEPFINPVLIENLFKVLENGKIKIASVIERIYSFEELNDPNIVKVVKDLENNALYFSRSPIPHVRSYNSTLHTETTFLNNNNFYKHVGIYGYQKDFLIKYANIDNSDLEQLEMLEQLRVLEHGFKIKMLETKFKSLGIDTQDDYEKALKMIGDEVL